MKQSINFDLCVPELKKGVRVGRKAQISLAMPPGLFMKVDEAANALSLTRAGFIKMCLIRAVKKN